MNLKTRIYQLQWVIAAIVLLMAGAAYFSIEATRHYVQRMDWADRQLQAISSVTSHANRYSEQIAELLLVGEGERADYASARKALDASFDNLERETRGEAAFLARHDDRSDRRDELYRVQRMRQLRIAIDRSVSELMQLRGEGRIDEAAQGFQRRIEDRQDAELEHLLAAATLDEQEEVDAAHRRFAQLWQRLLWTIVLATATALVICVVVARQLARAVVQPVARLTAGTEAIRRGDLAYRIASSGADELGELAHRFNEMAGQLERQQALVAGTQAQLEGQVAERTRELAVANRRLTDLDRLRVQFLADVSHELRTPLTALRGEAEVTLRHDTHPASVYRDTLVRIVDLARDMARMVDDLLFLARSETDTLRFVMQRANLGELMAQVEGDGRALGRARSIGLRLEVAAADLEVLADPQRLRQALMVVVDNAVKYSSPGQAVELRVERLGDMAQIVVCDHGHGVRPEDLPHVFDRYYRGDASGRAGTGLGLAIARWLVEKHGGDITLASEPGRGTQVNIRLPLAGTRA